MELEKLSATELTARFSAKEISAKEIAEATLANIAAKEPQVDAFLELSQELAYARAKVLDEALAKGEELGPLAAVPMAYKDNMHLVGTRTTCASKMLEHYDSLFNASCVERTLQAGAIPVGKTNMDEFAFGSSTESSAFKTTKNPWDVSRVPGGSSGGSAAAVAAKEVPLALGSDTGGSIRQPASFCGVVGLKPSYGVVSRYGVVAFGSSLDQVGPFARTVEDVALAMDALVAGGRDAFDSTSQAVVPNFREALLRPILEEARPRRVGIIPELLQQEALTSEVKAALIGTMEALEAAGCELHELSLEHMKAAISAYYVIAPAEAFSNLARFDGVRYGYQVAGAKTLAEQSAKSRALGFGEEAIRRQMLGAYILSSGVYDELYVPAQKVRTLITEDYAKAFEQVDVILMPSAPAVAWKFGTMDDPTAMYASDLFTISNNICGNCGISVPVGLGKDSHMPIGVQLQGPAFKDAELLRWSAAIETLRCEIAGIDPLGEPSFGGVA